MRLNGRVRINDCVPVSPILTNAAPSNLDLVGFLNNLEMNMSFTSHRKLVATTSDDVNCPPSLYLRFLSLQTCHMNVDIAIQYSNVLMWMYNPIVFYTLANWLLQGCSSLLIIMIDAQKIYGGIFIGLIQPCYPKINSEWDQIHLGSMLMIHRLN